MNSGLIGGITGGLAVFLAVTLLARAKPRSLDETGGTISASLFIRGIAVGSLLMASLAGYGFATSGQPPMLALAVVLGIGGVWVLYTTLPIFELSWNEAGVTGPSSALLSPKRLTIEWWEVRSVAPTLLGSICLEAIDGRRIYWSTMSSGYQLPVEELHRRRPDLQGGQPRE